MMFSVKRALIMACAVAVAAAFGPATAAADDVNLTPGTLSSTVSLTVLEPTPGQVITTSTLPLQVESSGYTLDARYAGTSDLMYVGHYHEILDGRLVDMTPLRDGNRDSLSMVGVTDGLHTLTIVPANNDHSMVMSAAVSIPFYYAGPYLPEPGAPGFTSAPSLTIMSPASGSTVQGSAFYVSASVQNFELSPVCFGKADVVGVGHWHIFVDQVAMSHMLTMAGGTTQMVSILGVSPGWHTFYALLVGNDHMPIMPMTMSMVTLYVLPSS
jgi:hypothetical protein